MDITSANANSLLAIPTDRPEILFPFDRGGIERRWRRLCGAWHPDRNRDARAGRVFTHLRALHQAALAKLDCGAWDTGRELTIITRDGRRYRFRYLSRLDTELGPCLVGREVMAYLLPVARAGLARRGYERLERLRFADASMRETMARHVPAPRALLETRDLVVVVLSKRPDFVPLASVHRFLDGSVEPLHVAWIVSGLLDIGCYLEWAGLCHQGIAPAHCLVSPRHHGVALTGGWWFAAPAGAALERLPARSARLAPADLLHHRIADPRLDALLIRQTALDLLGGADTPAPMRDFLTAPGSGSAIRDYREWQRALRASFGERRFHWLAVSPDDIYAMPS